MLLVKTRATRESIPTNRVAILGVLLRNMIYSNGQQLTRR